MTRKPSGRRAKAGRKPSERAHPKPTLASVADALGVSRTTVSNAYNRPDQLSPDLRARILATAHELGYAGPDPAGRMLRGGRAGAIGLLITESLVYAFRDPAAVAFIGGLASATETSGVGLLLVPSNFGRGGDDVSVVRNAAVDGFIFHSMPFNDPLVDAARERGLPMVSVESPSRPDDAFVGIDDYAAARKAAEHILDLGHRNVAVLTFRLQRTAFEGLIGTERQRRIDWGVSAARLWGFRHALEGVGIDWSSVPVHESAPDASGNTMASGYSGARELLDLSPRPTAIICMSDQLALGAGAATRDCGLEVGHDVSVVGFDDIPAAEGAGLTTIRQPLVEKGRIAGEMMLAFVEGSEVPQRRILLPTELILRGSTGPPP